MRRLIRAFAILLPLSLSCLWFHFDNSLPRNDEGFYFQQTQEIYEKGKLFGLAEGVDFAYLHRHWKPILHPAIAAPVLAFVDGNVQKSIAIFSELVFFLFLVYVWRLFSLYVSPWQAMLGTWSMGLLPWTFGSSTVFCSENSLLAMSAVAFFYWLKSNSLKENRYSWKFGLALGIGLTVRPIEMGLTFFPVLVWAIVRGYRDAAISKKDLKLSLVWPLACLLSLLPPYFIFRESPGILYIAIAWLLVGCFSIYLIFKNYRGEVNQNYQLAIGLAFGFALLWFFPGALNLFDWIYGCSFGEMAQKTGGVGDQSTLVFLSHLLERTGFVPLFFFATVWIYHPKSIWKTLDKNLFLQVLIMAAVPMGLGLISYNADTRYYYVGRSLLVFVTLSAALRVQDKMSGVRAALVGVAIFFQIGNVGEIILKEPFLGLSQYQGWLGYSQYFLEPQEKEPAIKVVDELVKFIDPKKSADILLIENSLGNDAGEMINEWKLTTESRQRGSGWSFAGLPSFGNPERSVMIESFAEKYNFILVGPLGPSVSNPFLGDSLVWAREFEECHKADNCNYPGVHFVTELKFESVFHNEARFLLFKTDRAPYQDNFIDHIRGATKP